MNSNLSDAASICSSVMTIVALAVMMIKPVREKVLGISKITEAQKCVLRQQMLHTYYRNQDARKLRQYEFENFIKSYEAYKAMGGNSFIDEIYQDVRDWKIVT